MLHRLTKSAKLLNYIQFANIISINTCLFKKPVKPVWFRKESTTICWEKKQEAPKQLGFPVSRPLFKYQKVVGSGYGMCIKICLEVGVLQAETIKSET